LFNSKSVMGEDGMPSTGETAGSYQRNAAVEYLGRSWRLVDLSLKVQPHWRFKYESRPAPSPSSGPFVNSNILVGSHSFTHVDAPSHVTGGVTSIDDVALARWWGLATVIDLTGKGENEAIGARDLAEGCHITEPGAIALLRTDRDLKVSPAEPAYWSKSPYVDRSGAEWLLERGVKAVGYDFPQDYGARHVSNGSVIDMREMPCHDILLREGVPQVEYLSRLHMLGPGPVLFFSLPLRLSGLDGSPCRAFALSGSPE
jgi:arylformamidase